MHKPFREAELRLNPKQPDAGNAAVGRRMDWIFCIFLYDFIGSFRRLITDSDFFAYGIAVRQKLYMCVSNENNSIIDCSKKSKRYRTILTIAGSDSGAGAGIQADLKTACCMGVYARTAITSVTVQTSKGVVGTYPIPEELVYEQINAMMDDFMPHAVKIGMVETPEMIKLISDALRGHKKIPVVIDPVMISTSGKSLCGELREAITSRIKYLFPLATIITPNIPEAAAIIGCQESEVLANPVDACRSLLDITHAQAILIKGGHSEGLNNDNGMIEDWLMQIESTTYKFDIFSHQKIETTNTHGTGCVLSSAIACGLAKGNTLFESVETGIGFLQKAILKGKEFRFADIDSYGPTYLFPQK